MRERFRYKEVVESNGGACQGNYTDSVGCYDRACHGKKRSYVNKFNLTLGSIFPISCDIVLIDTFFFAMLLIVGCKVFCRKKIV